MITDEYLQELIQRKIDGESYSSIRKELEEKNLDEAKIKEVLTYVDNNVLRKEVKKSNRSRSREIKIAGYALAILGVGISLSSYFGWFHLENIRILVYGPTLTGIAMIGYSSFRR